jgi:L-fucose mutarotase
MGHGDEIIFADARFPSESFNANVIRADGLRVPELLDAILPLFEHFPTASERGVESHKI